MSTRPLRTESIGTPRTQGQRIRFARIAAELSQEALGEQIQKAGGSKASKSLISQWERDGVKNPTNDNLFAIQAVTGFSAQWIATGKGDPKAKVAPASKLNTEALSRALAAVMPGADSAKNADIVADLYDALIDSPDITDKALSSLASAFSRRI